MGLFEEITNKKDKNSNDNALFNQITNSVSAADMLKNQQIKESNAKLKADNLAKQNNILTSYISDREVPNRATATNVLASTPFSKYGNINNDYETNQNSINNYKNYSSQGNKYELLNSKINDIQKQYIDYYNSPEYQNYVKEYYQTPMYQYKANLEKVENQDSFSFGEKVFTNFFGGLKSSLHGDRQYRTVDSNGKTVYVDLPNYQQLKGNKIKEQSKGLEKIYQDAMSSVGQMIPSIVAGTVTGGLGLGTEIGSLGTMAINAYSGSKNEKLLNGYSKEQSEMYAALSAGVEVLTEKMFGGLGKLMGKGALDEYVTNKLTKNISNRIAKGLAELGISSLGEGIEEVASDLAQPIIKKIALSDEKSLKELLKDENLGEDFFAGVLSSIILGGYNTVKNINANIDNNSNNNTTTQLNRLNNQNENISERIINNVNNSQNIDDFNTYSYIQTNNQKINNLRQSAVANNLNNSEETNNLISTIESVINDKDYNITFDNSIKSEFGNPVNAQITTNNNGEIEIKLNPNSDRAGESLLVHEISHAIKSQEMIDLVNDFASRNDEFSDAIKEIERTYGKNLTSEEVFADVCGQLFGNQEFINSLSNENTQQSRNIIKIIYEQIKRLLNKLTTKGRYRNFVQDLELKWRNSYLNGQTSLNNEIKSSIMQNSKGKYVKADRQVITGINPLQWETQVENYINNSIRNGKDIDIITDSGEILTITNDTAGKAKFRNYYTDKNGQRHYMNDNDFYTKLLSEVHIDELGSISKKINKIPIPDYKNHSFAKNGFDYRSAYFEDFNGDYYKITMSVGKNGTIDTIYNVGKLEQRKRPVISGSSATSSGANGSLTSNNILQNGTNVKSSVTTTNNNTHNSENNSKWQEHLEKNYKSSGTRTYFEDIKVQNSNILKSNKSYIKRFENNKIVSNDTKIRINDNSIMELQHAKKDTIEEIDKKISKKQEEYNSKKNKSTKIANYLLQQKIALENQKQSIINAYEKRIDNLKNRNNILKSRESKADNVRQTKMQEYAELAESIIIDNIDTWKDKKIGLSYKVEKMSRNFYDIIPDKTVADKMVDTYIAPIEKAEANLNKFIDSYNERISALKLSKKESIAVQMYGESKFNESIFEMNETNAKKAIAQKVGDKQTMANAQLYLDSIEYIKLNNLDLNKIQNAAKVFKKTYDELYDRINSVLKTQGYKEMDYRKNYFPHFIEDKSNTFIGKMMDKLGFKKQNNDIPTEIAGITDQFKPGKIYFRNLEHRYGNTTDYDALKGFDNYIRGAGNVIFYTEPIQKLRALENEIRYLHSDKGIQEQYDKIINSDLNSDDKQIQLSQVFENANTPLNNFVTELRSYTDGIANKKSELDRRLEQAFNRNMYSAMNNIQSRVSANMVGLNVSSAITNFIPITQAWSQIKTKNMLRAIKSTIVSNFTNDNFENNSVYLTNRLNQADRLSKTALDKVSEKMSFLFDVIDGFTSNVIVRGKYLENLENGMNHADAINNADRFANNVMAGRDKASMPTIYNSKNPLVKLFTSFQLEQHNQFSYLLKDLPRDLKNEAGNKIIGALIKMFLGAWLYNKLTEEITGRKAAFSPADIVVDSYKTATNDNLSVYDKFLNVTKDIVDEVPFVGGLLGGGRLPISSAFPDLENLNDSIGNLFSENEKTKKTVINNLKKELSKPLVYIVPPVGGGQLKKTIEGLSMYSKDKPVAGSYTSSGRLRFTVGDTILDKTRSAIFGQYSSKEARDYFDNGYSPLTENQIDDFMELDVDIQTFRDYLKDLKPYEKIEGDKNKEGKTISGTASAKKVYALLTDKKDYSDKELNYLLKKLSSEENPVDMNIMSKLDTNIDVYKYFFKLNSESREKYLNLVSSTNINQEKYVSAVNEISSINKKYKDIDNPYTGEKKKAYTSYLTTQKKNEMYKYIQSLNLSKEEKILLWDKAGYSINNFKDYMYKYINKLDISIDDKKSLWKQIYKD